MLVDLLESLLCSQIIGKQAKVNLALLIQIKFNLEWILLFIETRLLENVSEVNDWRYDFATGVVGVVQRDVAVKQTVIWVELVGVR